MVLLPSNLPISLLCRLRESKPMWHTGLWAISPHFSLLRLMHIHSWRPRKVSQLTCQWCAVLGSSICTNLHLQRACEHLIMQNASRCYCSTWRLPGTGSARCGHGRERRALAFKDMRASFLTKSSPLQDVSSYLSDGLHLSPKGNEFLFSHLWPLIEKKVSSLPLLLPYWRDIPEAGPELSLLGDGDH